MKQNKLKSRLPKVNNKIPNTSVGTELSPNLLILNNLQERHIKNSVVVHFSNPLAVCSNSLIIKLILAQRFNVPHDFMHTKEE